MKKYTVQEVNDIVKHEGVGYAIQFYMGYESIADENLAEKWKQAAELLNEIESILENAE